MYKLGLIIIIFLLSVFNYSYATDPVEFTVSKYNAFGLKLLQKIAEEEKGNFCFSPVSVTNTLSILNKGASGKTKDEILESLDIKGNEENFYKGISELEKYYETLNRDNSLEVKNSIYCMDSFEYLEEFKEFTKLYSNINLKYMPLQNDPYHSLNIDSESYFKGSWLEPFDVSKTKNDEFKLLSGMTKNVPFMNIKTKFRQNSYKRFSVIKLPYIGSTLSMYIVLPPEKENINKSISKFDINLFYGLTNRLEKPSKNILASIPRFIIDWKMDLIKSIRQLKLDKMFIEVESELNRINNNPRGQFVKSMRYKSKIVVNETGTEVFDFFRTEVSSLCSYIPGPFIANRPFIFFIVDNKYKQIYYAGRVIEPIPGPAPKNNSIYIYIFIFFIIIFLLTYLNKKKEKLDNKIINLEEINKNYYFIRFLAIVINIIVYIGILFFIFRYVKSPKLLLILMAIIFLQEIRHKTGINTDFGKSIFSLVTLNTYGKDISFIQAVIRTVLNTVLLIWTTVWCYSITQVSNNHLFEFLMICFIPLIINLIPMIFTKNAQTLIDLITFSMVKQIKKES